MDRAGALAEGAVAAALGALLGAFALYKLPQGGSVNLGAVVPIWLVAARRGPSTACLAGATLGLLTFLRDPQVVHPVQALLEYPVAYGLLGLAGAVRPLWLGASLTAVLKAAVHVVAGALFFASYAPAGTSPWLYSAGYNATVALPNLVVALLVLRLVTDRAPWLVRRESKNTPS